MFIQYPYPPGTVQDSKIIQVWKKHWIKSILVALDIFWHRFNWIFSLGAGTEVELSHEEKTIEAAAGQKGCCEKRDRLANYTSYLRVYSPAIYGKTPTLNSQNWSTKLTSFWIVWTFLDCLFTFSIFCWTLDGELHALNFRVRSWLHLSAPPCGRPRRCRWLCHRCHRCHHLQQDRNWWVAQCRCRRISYPGFVQCNATASAIRSVMTVMSSKFTTSKCFHK